MGVCVLKFGLPKSSYATCALRELCKGGASEGGGETEGDTVRGVTQSITGSVSGAVQGLREQSDAQMRR